MQLLTFWRDLGALGLVWEPKNEEFCSWCLDRAGKQEEGEDQGLGKNALGWKK